MIVAVVFERTGEAVRERLQELAVAPWRGHVIAEVRLDALEHPDPSILADSPVPVLATCRRLQDGGDWQGEEGTRRELLWAAFKGGAEVDVEMDVLEELPWARGDRVTASFHDFNGTPEGLDGMVADAFAAGAGWSKVAVRANDLADLLLLRRVARDAPRPERMITFGLGRVGVPSRLLFRCMGAERVYARWAGPDAPGDALAPGLPDLADLGTLYYPHPSLPAPVAAFGVLSDRAEHSIGPRVFNRVFRSLGIPAIYVPVSAPSLAGLRETVRLLGIRGLSVTIPHKEALATGIADEVHDLARRIGAANTLVAEERGLVAYNTDYHGVREPVVAALDGASPGGAALVLGAGGAGRAAAMALKDLGFDVAIWSRNADRAGAAAASLGIRVGQREGAPPRVLVNATPVGGSRDPGGMPVSPDLVGEQQIVFEMSYVRTETPLETEGRAKGARVVSGKTMYTVQARHQMHHFWAGLPDVAADLEEAVQCALAEQASF